MSDRTRLLSVRTNSGSLEPLLAADLSNEKRWSGRKSTVLAGTIISDQLSGGVACVVRDLSATGALIEVRVAKGSVVGSVDGLPDQFTLVLAREKSEVRCQVAWRQPATIGVRFMGGFHVMTVRAKPVATTKRV